MSTTETSEKEADAGTPADAEATPKAPMEAKPKARMEAKPKSPTVAKPKAPTNAEAPKAPAPKAPAENYVQSGGYSVVAKMVRKGKGKGRDVSNGGYVPVHLRDKSNDDDAIEDNQVGADAGSNAAGADTPATSPPPEGDGSDSGGAAGSSATPAVAGATPPDGSPKVAGSGPAGTAGTTGASFDGRVMSAVNLQSTSGSFDGEAGEGGPRKKAKRWQRRASAATIESGLGDGGASPAAVAASPAAVSVPSPRTDTNTDTAVGSPGDAKEDAATVVSRDVIKDAGAEGWAGKNEDEPAAKRIKAASPSHSPEEGGFAADANLGNVSPFEAGNSLDFDGPGSLAQSPPPSPPPPSPAASDTSTAPPTLAKLSVSKLRSLARYRGVNLAGCLEKSEMVAAFRKAGVDDTAAEQAERGGSTPNAGSTQKDAGTERQTENERKAAEHAEKRARVASDKLAQAEERAAAAEREAAKLRQTLESTKTSSRKKWAPAFQSTPFVPDRDKPEPGMFGTSGLSGMPGMSGLSGMPGRPGMSGLGGTTLVRPPKSSPDLRFSGGMPVPKAAPGGPGFEICWEFKQGKCNKGPACKWKHS